MRVQVTVKEFVAVILLAACGTTSGGGSTGGKHDASAPSTDGTGGGGEVSDGGSAAGGNGGASGGTHGQGGGGAEGGQGGGGVPAPACTRAPDCDTVAETRGYWCDNGICRACGNDTECRRVPHYGPESICVEGRCGAPVVDPCETERVAGCACDEARQCAAAAELVCGADGLCVADPCTLPGADGGEGCPCPAAPAGCAPGLRCEPAAMSCQPCPGGQCEVPGCELPGDLGCDCRPQAPHCDQGAYCAGDRCVACEGGRQEGCPCDAGACAGFVCQLDLCRPARACPLPECGENRACVPGDLEHDATCGDCDAGFVEEAGGLCVIDESVPPPPSECDDPRLDCRARNRDCAIGLDGIARCGGCLPTFIEAGGVCESQMTCIDAGCAAANRVCAPPGPNEHATCGSCRDGYQPALGCAAADCACVPIGRLLCGDLEPACRDANRVCEDADGSAECIGCLAGYLLDAARDECRLPRSCEMEGCAALNRPCVAGAAGADAHCDYERCLDGYTPEAPGSSQCVRAAECRLDSCPLGEHCRVANNVASCFDRPCPDGQAWNPATRACRANCPACFLGAGRTGRVAPFTYGGNCLCETEPGYFVDTGGANQVLACDADADGWVAHRAFKMSVSPDDAVGPDGAPIHPVREQARCEIRQVDQVALVAEDGFEYVLHTDEAVNSQFVPLVETDRNDRDDLLAAAGDPDANKRPPYGHPPGAGGRALVAREINALTKFCVDSAADYNDDGAPDAEQGQNKLPSARLEHDGLAKLVAQLSYFSELHAAEFQPRAGLVGKLVIRERTRGVGAVAGTSVGFVRSPSAGVHWRDCARFRDAAFGRLPAGTPTTTFDFAQLWDASTDHGMAHHSQFKCMAVVAHNDGRLGGAPERGHFISRDVATSRLEFQACAAELPGAGTPGRTTDIAFSCEAIGAGDQRFNENGFVAWAVVPYIHYGGEPVTYCRNDMGAPENARCGDAVDCDADTGLCQEVQLGGAYERGCINECEEIDWLARQPDHEIRVSADCPQYDPADRSRMACGVEPLRDGAGVPLDPVAWDSGRLVCGCTHNYGGETCNERCLTADVLLESPEDAPFNLATRDGYWMCLGGNDGDPDPLTGQGYSLTLKLSGSAVSRSVLASDGQDGGYILY